MSQSFFSDLKIPAPDCNLEVGSGTHAQQTAAVLERFEPVCRNLHPDWVFVYGDVNSTVAAALAAVKLGVPVAHVEAGLRSHDRSMPEEHNRVITDHIADLLFAPSRDAVDNLISEGIPAARTEFVGNVMIDTLVALLPRAREKKTSSQLGLSDRSFVLVTLHRPSNVDDPHVFGQLCDALAAISRRRAVVYPIHPRSRARLMDWGLEGRLGGVRLVDPLPYVSMLELTDAADFVITDSGGVQEETSFLGVPCLTVRNNTERPITTRQGTNRLVAPTYEAIVGSAEIVIAASNEDRARQTQILERWDGQAAERIAAVLCDGAQFA